MVRLRGSTMIRTAIAALLSLFAVSSAYAQSSSLDPPARYSKVASATAFIAVLYQ